VDVQRANMLESFIRHSTIPRLRDLKWFLDQQELERPDLQDF